MARYRLALVSAVFLYGATITAHGYIETLPHDNPNIDTVVKIQQDPPNESDLEPPPSDPVAAMGRARRSPWFEEPPTEEQMADLPEMKAAEEDRKTWDLGLSKEDIEKAFGDGKIRIDIKRSEADELNQRSPWFEEPPTEEQIADLPEMKAAEEDRKKWDLGLSKEDIEKAFKDGNIRIGTKRSERGDVVDKRSPFWAAEDPNKESLDAVKDAQKEHDDIEEPSFEPILTKEEIEKAFKEGRIRVGTKRAENGDFPIWTEPHLEFPDGRIECRPGCPSCCAKYVVTRDEKRDVVQSVDVEEGLPLPEWTFGGGCQEHGGTEEECKKWREMMTTTCAGAPGVCDWDVLNARPDE